MSDDLIKKKIAEKNKVKKNYLEKLELLKQSYGVEFKVDNLKDNEVGKIKFYNIDYKKNIRDVTIIYDNKYNVFNTLIYTCDEKDYSNRLNNREIIKEITKAKKLKLLVDEILKLNNDYKQELKEIDYKYSEINIISDDNSKQLSVERKIRKD